MASSEKLRLIQCGLGGMGKAWRDNVTAPSSPTRSPDFEVVAVVDINDQVLHEAGDQMRLLPERRFNELSDAIASIDADAVLTVTPPAVHVEHAQLAFANGLHLLTEKPIADTLDNAKRMVSLAARAGRQLVVAQNYRYNAQMATLAPVDEPAPRSARSGTGISTSTSARISPARSARRCSFRC